MKRDMELVRKIALALEDHEHGFAPDDFSIRGYSNAEVGYHVLLMKEGKLLRAVEVTCVGDETPHAKPRRLTWKGHEFAAAVRNETVWNKAKAVLGSAALPVWMKVLGEFATRQ